MNMNENRIIKVNLFEEIEKKWKRIIENYSDYTIEGNIVKLQDANEEIIHTTSIDELIDVFLLSISKEIEER